MFEPFAIYCEGRAYSPGLVLIFQEFLLGQERWRSYNRPMASVTGQRSQEVLRRALDEVKNSERNLRQVIDTIPTLAWCNLPDGSNEFLNKRWLEYTGLSPEESHGWGWQTAIHPEDRAPLMEKWRGLLVIGEPGEMEARLRRHDGVFRWFLMRVEPLRDETGNIIRWYGRCTDIETLKQTEAKLREDERELRRITDVIPQAIVVQDPSGTPTYANQATLDYTGLAAEDVIAPDFRERIFHPDDLERLRDERKSALSRGVPFEIEQRARRKDGQYRWFLIRYNPFRNDEGQVTRWYATGTDIDDRVRAEERTRNENLALREQIDRDSMFEDIVGSSEALRKVLRQIAKLASSDSTVLILDEVGDLPPEIQVALLRVLQEREIERVGSSKAIPIDVRVAAATHRDLNALVAEGKFREDLLYRLHVVPIDVPPLRERVADFPLLVECFIDRFGKTAGKKFRTIDKKSLRLLQAYDWHGNIRELQNVIERAVILCEGDTFSVDETWLRPEVSVARSRQSTLNGVLARHQKEMIEAALAECYGQISGPLGAATKVGLPARTLDSKIKRFKINKYRFKVPCAS
jgi:PAS domain S-box-containing protein